MKRWMAAFGTACCSIAASAAADEFPPPEEGSLTEPDPGASTPDEPPAPPTPTQITLVDAERYLHRSWHVFWEFPWQPEDWTTPVDYSRGVTYFRFDITELLEPAMLQFCYFQDRHVSEKHACGPQWTFTQPGVYYRRVENRALWQGHVIDWSRELLDFMLIDNLSEGRARTNVEVSIVLVGAGEALEAPESWQCPSEWFCAGDEPPAGPAPEETPKPVPRLPPPTSPAGPPTAPTPSEPPDTSPGAPEAEPPGSGSQPLTAFREEGTHCAWQTPPPRAKSPWGALTLGGLVMLGAACRRRSPRASAEGGAQMM